MLKSPCLKKNRLKNRMRKILLSLSAAALLSPAAPALAHGVAAHANNTAVVAQQKPFGIDGEPGKVVRILPVAMTDDMRFTPDVINVTRGETIKIALSNNGAIMHEMVLGSAADLQQHAEMMRTFPTMQHEAAYMAHVSPGASGEIVWRFNRVGVFDFACLIPGHSEAGMRGRIRVLDAPQATDNRSEE